MFKIEILINIEVLLFVIIFILTKQIRLYALFILFVLIHELSHLITGLVLGLKPKKLMIMPFGFKIQFKETNSNKKIELKKIMVAVAGPVINLVIICIACMLKPYMEIIYINLVIALFNLIPIYPLDGGRILKSVLNIKIGHYRAYRIVNKVSNICIILLTTLSSILVLYLKNISIVFVLLYLWYVVIKENKRYKVIRRIYDTIETNR